MSAQSREAAEALKMRVAASKRVQVLDTKSTPWYHFWY